MAALLQLGLHPGASIDVLDLRHFSGAQLAPLLHDEARRWNERFLWEYTQSIKLLEEYLDSRMLPGFVALDKNRRILGYTFSVYEASKAVLGDVWAFDEGSPLFSLVCERLLDHMLETLEASPGIARIESQLLMFPPAALQNVFAQRGFRGRARLFMLAEITGPAMPLEGLRDEQFVLERWNLDAFSDAASAIHLSYIGHEDATINDQYQSVGGAERFLNNIIRFPGCGQFDEEHSLLLRDRRTQRIEGVLLCSRVRPDTAHITQLCLTPVLHGRGLGTRMLSNCAAQLQLNGFRTISLTVTETNLPARRLYERFGFGTRYRFEAMTWDSPRKHSVASDSSQTPNQ